MLTARFKFQAQPWVRLGLFRGTRIRGVLNVPNSPSLLTLSAAVLQSSMTASLQKKSGSNYGPPGSSKMVFFVDDLNLPALDAYNTQSAIALIRQHIDYGHW